MSLRDYEIRQEPPLETRDDDPIAPLTRAVEEVRSAQTEFQTTLQTEVRGIADRVNALEVRGNRLGVQQTSEQQADVERRAIASYMRTGNDTEIRSAAATDNNPDGGWFVLPNVDTAINTLLSDVSPLRGLADVVTLGSGNVYECFVSMGQRGAQWVVERDDRPQDTARPQLYKHSYSIAELYACPTATRQLLTDASTDIAGWLLNNATQDFAITEGEAFWSADGANGKPKGILAYDLAADKDFTRTWGAWQYVAAGYTAPNDAQLADALVKIMMTLRDQYRGNARWLMNRNTAIRIRQIKDTTGRFMWAPVGNLVEGEQGTLLGFPVAYDDNLPDIGSGKLPIWFGDFKQAYKIVDREGIKLVRDEITTPGRVKFNTYKRVGGGGYDFNSLKALKISAS